jgi:DHA1 family multidrug resistance protein-like MFS transporter
MKLLKKTLFSPSGPLGVFYQYPILLRLGIICVCAEIGWAILIVILQFHFMDDLLQGQPKQLIASRIAAATLAFVAAETIFKIPMGSLADRYGPRPMIFFALSISALSPVLMTLFAREWYHFIPLRALDGLGAAALWPAMSSLMARSVSREAKASAMSVFNGAYCLGLALGPMTGLFLGHRFGNTAVFPLCTTLMCIGLVIAWRVLRDGVGARVAPAAASTLPDLHHIGEAFPQQGGTLLRGRPMLLRMMALYALSQCGVGLLANTMLPYLKGQFNIEEGDLPKMIALPALAVAVMALPLGRVADSIGRPQAVWISYIMAMFGMALIAMTSLFAPLEKVVFGLPVVLFGLGLLLMVGSYILGTPAWLGLTSVQVEDSRQGQALSLMQTAQGVGVVLGSALVAGAGHLLTRWDRVKVGVAHKLPKLSQMLHWKFEAHDVVPIHTWLWIATGLFALCLIGTLIWVREPKHETEAEDAAKGNKQPLEITGV